MAGQLLNLGAFIDTGDVSTFSPTTLFDPGALGKYFTTDKNGPYAKLNGSAIYTRTYQLVKLDGSSAATFGQVLVWLDYTKFSVSTVSSTTKRNDVAGFNITGTITAAGTVASTATAGDFIFILVGGIAPLINEAATTPAIGDVVVAGPTTAGRVSITAQGTAPVALPLGVALTAKAAAFGGITTTGDYFHVNVFPRVSFGF